ncbi:MAG: hypothetical protein NC548_43175 [Lachnospiraceae bacterium]|nr:hypothetical protein [Lachnospiraceae bacterium]MCM1231991.1 hypothetical protein [Ruminococcus flavefaciens]
MKQGWRKPYVPVPQGKRGMLWAWSGQPSQLPPPAVGVTASVSRRRARILPAQRKPGSMPGVCSRAVRPPENTAWEFYNLFRGTSTGNCDVFYPIENFAVAKAS